MERYKTKEGTTESSEPQVSQCTVVLSEEAAKSSTSSPQFKNRYASRIVAWIDIVLFTLTLVILAPTTFSATYIAFGTDYLKWNETYHERNPLLTAENWKSLCLAVPYAYIAFCCVLIWTANGLKNATNMPIKDLKGAKNKAYVWWFVNSGICLITMVGLAVFWKFWASFIYMAFHSVRIVFVLDYVQEIKSMLDQSTVIADQQDPGNQKDDIQDPANET